LEVSAERENSLMVIRIKRGVIGYLENIILDKIYIILSLIKKNLTLLLKGNKVKFFKFCYIELFHYYSRYQDQINYEIFLKL